MHICSLCTRAAGIQSSVALCQLKQLLLLLVVMIIRKLYYEHYSWVHCQGSADSALST